MNIRAIAAKQLVQVIGDGRSLSDQLSNDQLSVQDQAWCHAAVYGVLRQYYFLSACLAKLLKKPLKNKEVYIEALLLLGLYQLQFMRVPAHAAISETVSAAKKTGKPWAPGLVNAVLRQFQRSGNSRIHTLTDQQKSRHAPWLYQMIHKDWPQQAEEIFAQNLQQPPIHLRVNMLQTTRQQYMAQLAQADVSAEVSSYSPVAVTLTDQVNIDTLPGFCAGLVSVQDVAAQQAAFLLDAEPGMRVLDACSAPGGKLCHVLEAVPGVEVMALEKSADRMTSIRQNLERLKLSAQLVQGDASQTYWWSGQQFDRILVDAPCSATGVIRRHPDIQILRCQSDIAVLAKQQYQMLQNVWPMLAVGGRLVYATCSILKQENDGVIGRFVVQHPDAKCVEIDLEGGTRTEFGYQFLPIHNGPDGFYYARLAKAAV